MLGLIAAQLLLASASCQERCASDANRCYSGCGGSKQCTHHCDLRVSDCKAGCAKDFAREEAAVRGKRPSMPCGTGTAPGTETKARPCTEEELRTFREAANSPMLKKAFKCKDASGKPAPCPEEEELAKKMVKSMSKGDVCRDEDGKPKLCEGAEKKLVGSAKAAAHP